MTRKEQEQFVTSLTRIVTRHVIAHIHAELVPEDWDGHYLREYLYERFASARSRQLPKDRRMRVKYRNDVLEHNL
jgi:hypothetical protein